MIEFLVISYRILLSSREPVWMHAVWQEVVTVDS